MISKGEAKIASILDASNIKYLREKTFSDLKGGLFRFDFYLPDVWPQAVIEFNGEQHYHQIKRFHKQYRDFQRTQEHDRRKISYCLANDILIFVIPYWDLDKINTSEDLFDPRYIAHTRWHNDREWAKKKDR